MIVKYIKKFFYLNMPADVKKGFDIEVCRTNVSRAMIISMAFFVVELILLPVFAVLRKDHLTEYPDSAYLVLYILLLVLMPVYAAAFTKLSSQKDISLKTARITGVSFCLVILIWCMWISLLDQVSSGQVVVYTMAFVAIAVCPVFEPIVFSAMFIPVHILFAILLPYFQKSSELLFGTYVNTTTVIFISLVISRVIYVSRAKDYISRHIIRQKNEELEVINEKLLESNRKLQELSFTDEMTGLFNRRKFHELLSREWGACTRHHRPISLIMVDIDFFKQFNDIYGHQAGDDCIVQVANTISRMFRRSSDIVARYGGEEFMIALPGTDSGEAYAFAENIRSQIELLTIRHEDSSVADHVTISLGVCTAVPVPELSIAEFLNITDKALYKAKSNKRNITVALEC
jgi:diguanylate cyclase (GGDEF)-like protein